MKRHKLFIVTLCTLLLAGCNREDDIEGIFTGKEWHLAGFYQTHDWDNPNMGTPIENYNSLTDLSAYNITFYTDGTAVIVLPQGCRLQARWEADGAKRTFRFSEWRVISGNTSTLSKHGKLMYDNLQKIEFYQGDSNYIRLFDGSKCFFMQFGDLSKFNK